MRHPNKEEREQMELKRGKWKEKAGNNVEKKIVSRVE